MHSRQDEPFDRGRPGLMPEDGRISFHYVGDVIPMLSNRRNRIRT